MVLGVSATGPIPEGAPWNCTQQLPAQTTVIRYVSSTLRRVAVRPVELNVTDCATEVQLLLYDVALNPATSGDYVQIDTQYNATRGSCVAMIPEGTWGALIIGLGFPNQLGTLLMQFAVESVSDEGRITFAQPCPYDGPTVFPRTVTSQCASSSPCEYETSRSLGPEYAINATMVARALYVDDDFCVHPESAISLRSLLSSSPTIYPTQSPTTRPSQAPTANFSLAPTTTTLPQTSKSDDSFSLHPLSALAFVVALFIIIYDEED
jgi:hypothetical protein